MKRLLALFFLSCFAFSAHAETSCGDAESLFIDADLVVYGEFEALIQNKPVQGCSEANSQYSFGQCLEMIETSQLDDVARYAFRVDRILKVNKKAAGFLGESFKEDGSRSIDLPHVAVEAGISRDILNKKGVFFASEKSEFNDFIFDDCSFIDETIDKDTTDSLLSQWTEPLLVE